MVTGGPLTVTHHYAPSASNSLFEGTVTITNTSGATVNDVKYRRVVDWDYPKVPQSELVTIQGWPASALFRTSNGGFQSPNPLMPIQGIGTLVSLGPGGCPENANFTDCGPRDQGALFDFNFGSLAGGQSLTFYLYYGAAGTEAAAITALSQVGAEVYSLAQAADDGAGTGSVRRRAAGVGFGYAGAETTSRESVGMTRAGTAPRPPFSTTIREEALCESSRTNRRTGAHIYSIRTQGVTGRFGGV
ncbi:MAG: hypothetical protein SGI92_10800 [Bryobacteraceae bacterium]|nr:hypothetical protein [Bryobacteraceae bacterium]